MYLSFSFLKMSALFHESTSTPNATSMKSMTQTRFKNGTLFFKGRKINCFTSHWISVQKFPNLKSVTFMKSCMYHVQEKLYRLIWKHLFELQQCPAQPHPKSLLVFGVFGFIFRSLWRAIFTTRKFIIIKYLSFSFPKRYHLLLPDTCALNADSAKWATWVWPRGGQNSLAVGKG